MGIRNNKVFYYSGNFDPHGIIVGANKAKAHLANILPEGQFAQIEKKLERIIQETAKAAAQMENGFKTHGEVNNFARTIEGIDAKVAALGIEIRNIPLDKLKLPPELQAQFDDLINKVRVTETQIKSLVTELQNTVTHGKKSFGLDFFSNADLKQLLEARGNIEELSRLAQQLAGSKINFGLEEETRKAEELNAQIDELIKKRAKEKVYQEHGDSGNHPEGTKSARRYERRVREAEEAIRGTDHGATALANDKEYKALATGVAASNAEIQKLISQKKVLEEFVRLLGGEQITGTKLSDAIGSIVNQLNQLEQEYEEVSEDAELFMQIFGNPGKVKELNNIDNIINSMGNNFSNAADGIKKLNEQLTKMEERTRELEQLKSRVKYVLSFANAFHLLRNAIIGAKDIIFELDAAFNEIAVVTNFTNEQLWQSFDSYNEMAQRLGVTTTDAIKTSALYYQQGLETAEVMRLTEETIKMASIAGMDFAEATDRMTAAIRGFKLEMEDASRVNDVFSALAAASAVDTDELSQALTKTASIAASAGMELETTSALLSLMIENTREAPENLGTAMKTVIARFQELKKAVGEVEVEGEIVDVNKVETALRSVGVNLRDELTGQFRDLDDVFLELSSIWDTLDRNTQRYVATIAAGSRLRFNRLLLAA